MKPPWKSGKIVLNRGWICSKLSNLPESVPILCAVELIELPFLPRTTEAQETLGPKPQTMVLCLRGAHGWVFTHKHAWLQCSVEWLRIQLCSRAGHASVYCCSAQSLILWTEHSTTHESKENLFHLLNNLQVKIQHVHNLFLLNIEIFKVNQFLPWTKEQCESRWSWHEMQHCCFGMGWRNQAGMAIARWRCWNDSFQGLHIWLCCCQG